MNGFLNLLKPPGMSSAAAVAAIKRITGEKTGHAGTLDPEACGVLPVMIGRAGRLLDYLPDEKKIYTAEIAFTGATDTQDAQGRITVPGEGVPDERSFLNVLPGFVGEIDQIPPAYSALKLNGVPLYKAARRGEMIEKPARRITVHAITYLGPAQDGYRLRVNCSRGTYIRTLCHDIGVRLGKPAHMRLLLRELSAGFSISDSVLLEEADTKEKIMRHLVAMDDAINNLGRYDVERKYFKQARNGARIPAQQGTEENVPLRVYLNGLFLGVAVNCEGWLVFRVICAGPDDDFGVVL